MLSFLLTPKWLLFHTAIAAAVVSFVVLGSWQWEIFRENDARHDVRAREPVELTGIAEPGRPIADAADTPVTVTGQYVADGQRLVPGRIRAGVLGSYVATPLEYGNGSVVFVVRGWVDSEDDPATAVPDGPITVTGHLLTPETPEHATVRSDVGVEEGEVGYLAPDAFTRATEIPSDVQIQGYILASEEAPKPAAAPAALNVDEVAPIRDVSPWQNLSYWAQWWVFAAAAFLFWFSAVRSAARKRRTPTPEVGPGDDDSDSAAPSPQEHLHERA